MTAAEKGKVPPLKKLYIDIGATSKEEAEERIRIGDPMVIDADPIMLTETRLMSRALDNRLGTFVSAEIIRELHEEGLSLREIADRLNSMGHVTRRGKAWNPVQVSRVLSRAG